MLDGRDLGNAILIAIVFAAGLSLTVGVLLGWLLF
jgi:hypothetical protein